jgi:hypothetical protein
MRSSLRHVFAISLFAFTAAAVSACDLSEEPTPSPAPIEPASLEVPASSAQGPLAEGDRPISDAELEEVRRAEGLAATMEILTEDGESMKLESGITSVHEDSLNGVDITFTPLDAAGRPSQRNLQVVYQRSDTAPPHFYFVSNESGAPSQIPAAKPGDEPVSSLCIGGSWSNWSTSGGYCGYRWLCSKRKWNHDAWFEYQSRWKRCWNGNIKTESRTHFAHCGC